jgi:hypothetical protein
MIGETSHGTKLLMLRATKATFFQDAGGTIEVYVVGDSDRRRRGNGNDRTSEAARATSKPPSAAATSRAGTLHASNSGNE